MDVCILCEKSLQDGRPTVTIRQKGSDSINAASEQRGTNIVTIPGQTVHQDCRRDYCNPRRISLDAAKCASDQPISTPCLRSHQPSFDYKVHCLFCGQGLKYDGKKKQFHLIKVRTMDFQTKINEACKNRSDKWSKTVHARLLNVTDLHAYDAVYHGICSVNFRTGRNMPSAFSTEEPSSKKPSGRPPEVTRAAAFQEVTEYLRTNDNEQITVTDLVKIMEEYLDESGLEPYSNTYMKKKLLETFGDEMFITEINGKSNVVTFRTTVEAVLQDFYNQDKEDDPHLQKLQIIKTAAKLIKSDIKSLHSDDKYPNPDDIGSKESNIEYIPVSLQLFLKELLTGKETSVKLASLGQALIQATRPRVLLAPLQLGLGIQLHHHFASRFLIETLNHHGFCCSYPEVQKYERSAAKTLGTDVGADIPDLMPGHFVQFVADNVDHNIDTLDGRNTFHGMGIIVAATPKLKNTTEIPKVSVSTEELLTIGKININHFDPSGMKFTEEVYDKLPMMNVTDHSANLDLLWKASFLLRSPRPAWSGMMQMLHDGNHPGPASINFMPMIDLDPGNLDCIFSTLQYVSKQAARYGVSPVITFDQPLYWKAHTIIASEPSASDLRRIVLKLGGFHMEMSFVGAIGHLMAGSGLHELLEVVYAGNTVEKMFSGKAIARAIRGHLLVDAALNTLLISSSSNLPLPNMIVDNQNDDSDVPVLTSADQQDQTMETDNEDLKKATELYDKVMSEKISVDEACSAEILSTISNALETKKESLKEFKTGSLWLQYMDMVDILRCFIKSERTGNWEQHLKTVAEMLPYLAASGHNLYTKSAYIYLQDMLKLEAGNPKVYNNFLNGLHVIRRSDRYWAGLSSDLVIEQVLMRSLKTSGGLTRGRGMTEAQRITWLLGMPACAQVNSSMQSFSGMSYATSEQHKETTQARQDRDTKDTKQILLYLTNRNPFSDDPTLHSIATGIIADSAVNVNEAKEVGNQILSDMIGKKVEEYKFQRKRQVVTLDHRTTIKIDDEVKIDSQLLFQRLVIAGERCDNLPFLLTHELCSYPTALFEAPCVMRQPNKVALAEAMWDLGDQHATLPTGGVQYVLDGGSLLHRIPWSRGTSFEALCQQYVSYVKHKYGNAIIVFDGYGNGPTIKDMTQKRRTKGRIAATVHFTSDMQLQVQKEPFLNNTENKQQFIVLLSSRLTQAGCICRHARDDADVMIVQTALESATKKSTVLIGEDTDLLVLLCYHYTAHLFDIFFTSEPKQSTHSQPKVWNIRSTQNTLGPVVCQNLLFIHAFLGCDCTSRIYGIGKGTGLKKARNSENFIVQARKFQSTSQSVEELKTAGESIMVCLYGGKAGEDLDILRYRKFQDKVASSTVQVQLQSLPPTSGSTYYHSLRTYYQIQQWKGTANTLNPINWGWKLEGEHLVPIMTDLPPAPQSLLQIIRCKCKKDCSTMRCTCRKHGLECSSVCGECSGSTCSNAMQVDVTLEEEDVGDE